MSLLGIIEGLAAAEVRFVLVGGLAARAHGVERVTDDVDICYDTGIFNERALVKLLQSWQAYPRDAASGLPYKLTRARLHERDTIRLQTVHGYIDIMREVPGVGPYRDVVAHADTMRLASGQAIPLISLDKLIRAKEVANRGKDHEVLHALRALRAARRLAELGLSVEDGASDGVLGEESDVSRSSERPDDEPPAPNARKRGRKR